MSEDQTTPPEENDETHSAETKAAEQSASDPAEEPTKDAAEATEPEGELRPLTLLPSLGLALLSSLISCVMLLTVSVAVLIVALLLVAAEAPWPFLLLVLVLFALVTLALGAAVNSRVIDSFSYSPRSFWQVLCAQVLCALASLPISALWLLFPQQPAWQHSLISVAGGVAGLVFYAWLVTIDWQPRLARSVGLASLVVTVLLVVGSAWMASGAVDNACRWVRQQVDHGSLHYMS